MKIMVFDQNLLNGNSEKSSMNQKNYSVEFNNGYTVIKLTAIDYFSCKSLLNEINAITEKPNHILVNCEGITSLPKDWIRALMLVQLNLKKINKNMKLIHVNKDVIQNLKREGIENVFQISKDAREALIEFGLLVKRKLDMEFLNPFLSATLRVLKVQAQIEASTLQIYMKKNDEKLYGDISGVIGIVSDSFNGSVVLSFPKETFLKIMSNMLGESVTEINQDIRDGAGEIVNMIFGQAKIELNSKGFGINTALPSIVSGEDHTLYSQAKGPTVVVPFKSSAGEFFIEICLSH